MYMVNTFCLLDDNVADMVMVTSLLGKWFDKKCMELIRSGIK